MSSPAIDISDARGQDREYGSNPKIAAMATVTKSTETANGVSSTPITPAEHIPDSVDDSSKSLPQPEAADTFGLGKQKRADAVGAAVGAGLFHQPEDLEPNGGRIQNSDFVRDHLLKTEPPSVASDENLGRIGPGGDEHSLSSKDLQGTNLDLPCEMWADYQMPVHPLLTLPSPMDVHQLNSAAPPNERVSETNGTIRKKKRRRKPREIDESRAVEPTDEDVLFGRGGKTNKHVGNIRFRQKALDLRPRYEQSSKGEKQRIAEELVEYVRCEGGRFLERGKEDGLWHEVIGNGVHSKASQALRERIRGGRKEVER